MRKTYKFFLPDGVKLLDAKLCVSENKIKVKCEFEDRFEPKDGDYLVSVSGNTFIYNGNRNKTHFGAYCGITCTGRLEKAIHECRWTLRDGCRYATDEEKKAFDKRLSKDLLLRWDYGQKKLIPINWRAERGEAFYCVAMDGNVTVLNDTYDGMCYKLYTMGNYFKTVEDAKPYADKIKELYKTNLKQ